MRSENKPENNLKNKKQRSSKEEDRKVKIIALHATKLWINSLVHSPSVHRVNCIH